MEHQKCTQCKKNLLITEFKERRDGSYLKGCKTCNAKACALREKSKCIHGKRKARCVDCGGSNLCKHLKIKEYCKECGGSQICLHKKQRSQCVICKGGSLCEHKKITTRCKICCFSGYLKHSIVKKHVYRGLGFSKQPLHYLGCTIDEYMYFLESKFDESMNWDNFGDGDGLWQIDHIVPLKYNDPNNVEVISRLHYTNTQPVWKHDNVEKGNKMILGIMYNHHNILFEDFKDF